MRPTTPPTGATPDLPTRGLVIRDPWIGHILAGRKTWEIPSANSKVRGRIALIRGGSGTIVGTANMVDSIGPLTLEGLAGRQDKHAVPREDLIPFLEKYRGRAYAWVLEDVEAFPEPVPYEHPSGAVIWVRLAEGSA